MILVVDNYDSFTYNLVQRLGEIDPELEIEVHRNDKISVEEIAASNPSRLILSPGPCTPNEAGISVACAEYFTGKIPVLGVCLGHQAIAQAFGAKIVRAPRLMHGKTDMVEHDACGLFEGIENPFEATRYHSLIVQPGTLSSDFDICAWTDTPEGTREIMGIRHKRFPVYGLQFHPESFLTLVGTALLERFLRLEMPHEERATRPPAKSG